MLNADETPEVNVRAVLESPYTRMPIWRGSTDNIIGIVHAKDVLRVLAEVSNEPQRMDVVKIAQKPWFVPDTTSVPDQLNAFLRRKAHIAIVVDEYGEVEGLVTLEDILEEIVGDITDEHDTEVQGVHQEADGSIVVDGSVPIRDLNRALDWSLPDDEATTVAGLVIHESQDHSRGEAGLHISRQAIRGDEAGPQSNHPAQNQACRQGLRGAMPDGFGAASATSGLSRPVLKPRSPWREGRRRVHP